MRRRRHPSHTGPLRGGEPVRRGHGEDDVSATTARSRASPSVP